MAPIPARIGRFRVLDVLGHGAMGIVYRGLDEALDRHVALKVMAGQIEPEARARFKREAQAAARLQHPNIITVYELGEHEGAPFMALELLEGVDLQRAIEGGLRPDPRVTLPIVLQLLAGLGQLWGWLLVAGGVSVVLWLVVRPAGLAARPCDPAGCPRSPRRARRRRRARCPPGSRAWRWPRRLRA